MPQSRLSLAERQDLASDPRLANPQIRAQVMAKLAPEDAQWIQTVLTDDARANQAPNTNRMLTDALSSGADYVKNNPTKTAAALGGIVGPAVVTGGASLPVSVAASFLGGAGGAGAGMTLDALRQYFGGDPSAETLPTSATGTAAEMGKQGATQAVADLTGRSVGAATRLSGTKLLDASIGAQDAIRRDFPDVNLAETLASNSINPYSQRGVRRANALRSTSAAETRRLASEGSARGVVIRRSDVVPYLSGSEQMASDDVAANLSGGNQQIADAVDHLFEGRSPLGTGDIRAEKAPNVVRSLQRRGKAAQNAANQGNLPSGLDASINKDLANGVRQAANEKIGPEYAESNARTQSLIAASKVARRGARQPLGLPSWKAMAVGGVGGSGLGMLSGDQVSGLALGAGTLALGTPQISAPVAIGLYQAGKLPYAALLKVIGPDVARNAGITGP
jgi:hypothetical protein